MGMESIAPLARDHIVPCPTTLQIERIPKQWRSHDCAVDPDLMRPARGDLHFHQIAAAAPLQQGEKAEGR